MNISQEIDAIRRMQEGDQGAFRAVYEAYRHQIYSYCLRMLRGNTYDAQDALQEVFMTAFKNIASIDHPSSFRFWIFTVTRNEVYGRLRKKAAATMVDIDNHTESIIDDETPYDNLADKETSLSIVEAMDHLSPHYKEAIYLREFEGLSYVEIAAIVGDTESAVKARLFKARKALGRLLGHLEDERNTK